MLPFVGRKCEQIHEARLVEIAHRGFAVWQNPFGMLSPEIVIALVILMTTALLIEVRVLSVCGGNPLS